MNEIEAHLELMGKVWLCLGLSRYPHWRDKVVAPESVAQQGVTSQAKPYSCWVSTMLHQCTPNNSMVWPSWRLLVAPAWLAQ